MAKKKQLSPMEKAKAQLAKNVKAKAEAKKVKATEKKDK